MDFVNWLKSQRDRAVAWLLIAIGGLCILGGWVGVTNTVQVYNQLTYLVSGAIVGLFFLGVGVALLLSADFHDEWRKLDRIEAALRGRPLPEVDEILDLHAEERPAPSGAGGGAVQSESVTMAGARPAGSVALPIRQELARVMPGLAVSAVLIALAWIKSTNSTNAQVGADALLIGVYGVLACGIGVALHSRWLRQSLARRKGALLGPLVPAGPAIDADAGAAVVDLTAADDAFYVAEGGKRYHRAGCAIVASQRAVPATPAQVAHLVACELCN